jgi:hypothetical protein
MPSHAAGHGRKSRPWPLLIGDYEIRIKGRLSDSLLDAFEGLTSTVQPVATVLCGPVQDQAALYRLLDRIQSLGLELVEIRQLPASADEAPAEPSTNRQIRRLVLRLGAESSQVARILSGAGWWTDSGTDTERASYQALARRHRSPTARPRYRQKKATSARRRAL